MKFHAFGDSFVVGDLDDFDQHPTKYSSRLEYLKYNVSFASLVAKELGMEFHNYAERGSGNYPQLDRLLINITDGKIRKSDYVFFGITTVVRDRVVLTDFKKAMDFGYGPCMADRETLIDNQQSIVELDYFYIISILEKVKSQFDLNIKAMHLFDNPLSYSEKTFFDLFKSDLIISCGDKTGTSLVDILNDAWCTDQKHPYHTRLNIPSGYEKFYTKHKHPSIEGHKKIADWILKNVYGSGNNKKY
jgi:hypothetical protein